ncbi:hypothetical protein F4805DRAFT_460978 [Annulohypoxylon moriforme]|nr:hypothetical protein F4805DRAFT_460978 [Annulohypoxylon moriforme]
MAIQNGGSTSATSSTTSNSDGQSTDIDSQLYKPDEEWYKYCENDPQMLDPQSTQDIGYEQGIHDFRFNGLSKLIQHHTALSATKIRPDKPYNDYQSRELHNEHQRTIWHRIWEQAKADDDIPTALFSPPRTYIRVCVTKWPISGHYCCPCDITVESCETIEIRAPEDSPDGITKDMFVQQVSDALYGEGPGADRDSGRSGYRIGVEDDRPVIERFDYMIHGDGFGNATCIMGDIYAMTRGISSDAKLLH